MGAIALLADRNPRHCAHEGEPTDDLFRPSLAEQRWAPAYGQAGTSVCRRHARNRPVTAGRRHLG